MRERWGVSGAPGELCGQSDWNRVLDQVWHCKVTNFRLLIGKGGGLGIQLSHFHQAELSWITDIVKRLDLLQVLSVMSHPKILVVLHWCNQLLHQLRSVAALRHSAIDLVLSSHELFVLTMNLIDNARSVNRLLIGGPVNSRQRFRAS